MKTFIGILILIAVAGYNIWVHYYNNDVDDYNKAIKNHENGMYEKSFPVFERLCNQKDWADACDMLGRHYEEGLGVMKDKVKATSLYQKSCDGGDNGGCYNLAISYYNGDGVKANLVKSIEILSKLCNNEKNKEACDTLKEINNEVSSDQNYQSQNDRQSIQIVETKKQKVDVDEILAGIDTQVTKDLKAYDDKLNKYYKQIMSGLNGQLKNDFKIAQRAWVKYATDAKNFFAEYFTEQNPQDAHYLAILQDQVEFFEAIINGKTLSVKNRTDLAKVKRTQEYLLFNDEVNEKFEKMMKSWEEYAEFKKYAANMMGLNGEKVYEMECEFMVKFLSDFKI